MKSTQSEISLTPPVQNDFDEYQAAVTRERQKLEEILPYSVKDFYFEPLQGRQVSHHDAVQLCHRQGGSIVDWGRNKKTWQEWWEKRGVYLVRPWGQEDEDEAYEAFWAQSSNDQCSVKTTDSAIQEGECESQAQIICEKTKENPKELKYAVKNLAIEWKNL